MSIGFFVMIMTNFIMNVAAIAISLPVALVIAPYLGVAPEVIFYAALVTAGMPFMLLIGAAPNAIAYDSNQFTTVEFFIYGVYGQHHPDGGPGLCDLFLVADDGDAGETVTLTVHKRDLPT